jgi:hypothetical protein
MADDIESPRVLQIVKRGADIAGAAVASSLELLALTPPACGAVVGATIAAVLRDFAGRALSAREQTRIGATRNYAAGRISARIMRGDLIRADGFFDAQPDGRTPGVALLEGVLLRARDEFEEKKLLHLAALYANIAFVTDVSPSTAHLLLKSIDRMSYRQMAIVALVGGREWYDLEKMQRPDYDDPEMDALKRELMDLHSNDLGTMGLLRPKNPYFKAMLSPLGRAMFELAALDEIPAQVTATLDRIMEKPEGWVAPPPRLSASDT